MGQSLAQNYVHLIFGTKGRQPFIKKEIRERLNAYLIGILKKHDCPSLRTNCVEDHVHSVFRLSKNISLSKIVGELKIESSKWMKEIEGGHPHFTWQIGYAAFSVSSSKLETVIKYVENQEEHHKKQTFQEEVEAFFEAYNVSEYDVKFFWT